MAKDYVDSEASMKPVKGETRKIPVFAVVQFTVKDGLYDFEILKDADTLEGLKPFFETLPEGEKHGN